MGGGILTLALIFLFVYFSILLSVEEEKEESKNWDLLLKSRNIRNRRLDELRRQAESSDNGYNKYKQNF
jgi:hypothetical protein